MNNSFSSGADNKDSPEITIIYPPYVFPISIPSSILYLATFLRDKGVDAIPLDLSLDFFYYFFSLERIERILEDPKIEIFFPEWLKLLKNSLYINKIKNFINVFKEEKFFYDIDKYEYNFCLFYSLLKSYENIYSGFIFSPEGIYLKKDNKGEEFNIFTEEEIRFSLFNDYFMEAIYNNKKILNSKLIGISINYDSQLFPAITLSNLLKKLGKKIVVGGSMLTKRVLKSLAENSNKYLNFLLTYFDYIIVCEGETPLLMLCNNFQNDKELDKIPNLVYKKNGIPRLTFMGIREDLNLLPIPNYSLLDIDKYISPIRILPFHTSRGCYWKKCSFCTGYLNYSRNLYSTISINKLENALLQISKDYPNSIIMFTDSTMHPYIAERISEIIYNNSLKIKWTCEGLRMEKELDYSFFKKLEKGKCISLTFGIETFSNNILKKMKKGIIQQNVIKNLRYFKKLKIWAIGNFIAFFPGETKEERIKTIENANKLLDSFIILPIHISWGSDLYNNHKDYGVKDINEYEIEIKRNLNNFYEYLSVYRKNFHLFSHYFLKPHLYCYIAKFGKKKLKKMTSSNLILKYDDTILINPEIIFFKEKEGYISFNGWKVIIFKGISKCFIELITKNKKIKLNNLLSYLQNELKMDKENSLKVIEKLIKLNVLKKE